MNRKSLLHKLLETRFGGSQAAFARALKRSPSQIHQWLSGHRMLGDAGARHIEMTLGLPAGWMDGGGALPEGGGIKTVDELRRENLETLTRELGGVGELAAKIDRSSSQVSQWINGSQHSESGKPRRLSSDSARYVEERCGKHTGWLDQNHQGSATESNDDENSVRQPTDDEFALVPQLDIAAACGDGRFVDHVVVKGGLAFKHSSLRDCGVPERAARIIYASGGGMAPTIQDGCVVLLNTADVEPKEGKVYAICTPDGGLVLKRLIWDYHPAIGSQTWVMRSDNPDKIAHPDKILPPDTRTMIVGRAVWNDNRL